MWFIDILENSKNLNILIHLSLGKWAISMFSESSSILYRECVYTTRNSGFSVFSILLPTACGGDLREG